MQQGTFVGVGVGVGFGVGVGVSAGVGVAGGEANAISGTIATKMMRNIIVPNHFEFFTQILPQVDLRCGQNLWVVKAKAATTFHRFGPDSIDSYIALASTPSEHNMNVMLADIIT